MFDEPSSPIGDREIPFIPEGGLAKTPRAQHEEEYASFDSRELSRMDNKALAVRV
jgi:hypothetical protein